MIDPSIDEILDPKRNLNIESKFELITMISKRAKQINNGAEVLVKTNATKPVTIALQEIYHGKIKPVKKEIKKVE